MKKIYIGTDEQDLIFTNDPLIGNPVVDAFTVGTKRGTPFAREVYDLAIKAYNETTSDPLHTAARKKFASFLRYEDGNVKISIAAANELLNEDAAREFAMTFEAAQRACAEEKKEKAKRIERIEKKFAIIFLNADLQPGTTRLPIPS